MPTATRSSGSSHSGGRVTAMYASIACESASMPECAVTEAGHVRVSSGSQMAVRGIRYGLEMPTFIPSSGSPMTDDRRDLRAGARRRRERDSGTTGPGTRCSP